MEDVKTEEAAKLKALKKQNKALRQKRIDLDFEEEQLSLREVVRQKQLDKQLDDVKHKIEVVRLGQQRTQGEMKGLSKELNKKKEAQLLQKDAWVSEL